jgi:hypothetical protein
VDRIECAQGGLSERAGRDQELSVERDQANRVEQLAGS